MGNLKFTVMDVETTGLFPGRNDRIIEIALISLDSEGNVLQEFETLVNPDRDLGPINIHKITAAMVKDAPKFNELLGNIAEILAGSILVGHNVSFDYKFLDSEFQRAGFFLPKIPHVCTLNLAKKVDTNIPSGKLDILCDYYNIPLENSHSAYADCKATSKLFTSLIKEYGLNSILQALPSSFDLDFGSVLAKPKCKCIFKRSNFESQPKEKNYISELIKRLPVINNVDCEGALEYLALLDEILADRKISSSETQLLYELAMEYNISQGQAIELHKQYLSELIRIALLDGIISDFEMRGLVQVTELLNISKKDFNELLSKAKTCVSSVNTEEKSKLRGKKVCFTGTLVSNYNDMPITRELAQRLALEHGLVIKKGVTKDLDFLVTSDPESMSGKAKKARDYKVLILAEHTFWTMLGIQIS